MWWMIICIVVVGISCFFIGFCTSFFCIRRSNNNRQNVRDEVLINDSNNRQNESDVLDENRNNIVRENTGDHEVILVNADINKDLSISHSSYQINSKVLKKKSNSFGKSSIQNLAISKTNLIINNNIAANIIDDLKRDHDKVMSFFRQPGLFTRRLEKLEKIEKQRLLRRGKKKRKSKIKDMPAHAPIDEDIKEDDEI